MLRRGSSPVHAPIDAAPVRWACRRGRAPLLRVWVNRSYATTAHAVATLRREPPSGGVHVLGTHVDPGSPVLAACDAALPEPEVDDDSYLAWALDLCRRHAIDVAVPRARAALLSAHRAAFAAVGTVVAAADPAVIALLDDKAASYAAAQAAGVPVPLHRVVRSGAELLAALPAILDADGTACIKPVTAAGGAGFRVLRTSPVRLAELLDDPVPTVHPEEAAAALDEPGAPPFLLMPVLPGPEVSVDCLADAGGTLRTAVARTKHPRRVGIDEDDEAVAHAAAIVALHRVAYLSNTQLRYWRRPGVDAAPRPYLLETNPRASAGLYQTEAAGLRLLRDAVDLAAGREPAPATRRAPSLIVLPSAVVTAG